MPKKRDIEFRPRVPIFDIPIPPISGEYRDDMAQMLILEGKDWGRELGMPDIGKAHLWKEEEIEKKVLEAEISPEERIIFLEKIRHFRKKYSLTLSFTKEDIVKMFGENQAAVLAGVDLADRDLVARLIEENPPPKGVRSKLALRVQNLIHDRVEEHYKKREFKLKDLELRSKLVDKG